MARAEKEEADLAVENLLQEGAQLLPFATTSSTSANSYEVGDDGSLVLDSWSSYLSSNYGTSSRSYLMATNPSTLYSFSLPQAGSSSNLQSNSC